jgi:DNA-binding NtrC family response regulator
LKNRTEDIPLLIRHFLEKFSEKIGKRVKGVSRQTQKLLLTHPWPGNVRELKNAVESAIITCQKEFIDVVDLPKHLQNQTAGEAEHPFFGGEKIPTIQNLEAEYISYLLKANDNNIRRTAKLLNISRSTLYKKLKKYAIQFPRE